MSIVKMKKLRLIAMQADKQALLHEMQLLGCVEISETSSRLSDPEWTQLVSRDDASVYELQLQYDRASTALSVLDKYAPGKSSLFPKRHPVSGSEFFSADLLHSSQSCIDALHDIDSHLRLLAVEESQIQSQLAFLQPWQGVDLPLDYTGSVYSAVIFGSLSANADLDAMEEELSSAVPESKLIRGSHTDDQQTALLICHRSVKDAALSLLRTYSFSVVSFKDFGGTAAENLERLREQLEQIRRQTEEYQLQAAGYADRRELIKLTLDRLTAEIDKLSSVDKLLRTETAFTLEGWCSEPEAGALAELFGQYDCAWECLEPAEDEIPDVPIKLKNNAVTEPLMMVTEMYSLPAYDGIDPNPLIMPFFTIFFGIMYADIGYGLILLILGIVGKKLITNKGTIRNMCGLLVMCGISTIIFGFIFGGFFGDTIPVLSDMLGLTHTELWSLINPMEEPILLLIGSVVIGVIHILVGMGISAYMSIRDGRPLDALFDVGSWWLLFAGIALGAMGITWWVLIAGVAALILTQGRDKPTIRGKFIGGLGSLYDIINYLSDVLSYTRLMALLLATSVIGSVVNVLGSLSGSIFVFIIIFLIGHALNMVLNIIGTFVHAARLQFLEFFGKFYKDGGRAFEPLSVNTKYVEIIKEEN